VNQRPLRTSIREFVNSVINDQTNSPSNYGALTNQLAGMIAQHSKPAAEADDAERLQEVVFVTEVGRGARSCVFGAVWRAHDVVVKVPSFTNCCPR
jgi:hypothetical protein